MKKYWFFTIILCLVLYTQAQNKTDYIYDFPINPNSSEWDDLITETDRFEAMQIPPDLLKSMSTENLIITCMNYPAFGHYTFFGNMVYGINHLINNFNGLQELLLREDAPSKMLSVYSKLRTSNANVESINPEFWGMRFCFFELLLTKDEIIDRLNEDERKILIKEVQKKITGKIDDGDSYSLFSLQPSLLITAKVLDRSNVSDFQRKKKENTGMELFLQTGDLQDVSLFEYLMESGNNFTNSK